MENFITNFRKRKLKKITKKLVTQSFDHKKNIIEYYQIMAESANIQFNEDNISTLKDFLRECFEESLNIIK